MEVKSGADEQPDCSTAQFLVIADGLEPPTVLSGITALPQQDMFPGNALTN